MPAKHQSDLTLTLCFLRSSVTLFCSDDVVLQLLSEHFRCFIAEQPSSLDGLVTAVITRDSETYTLIDNNGQTLSLLSLDRLLKETYRTVVCHWVEQHQDLLWLHAAAIKRDDRCLLLTGPWGAGKSTLTIGLLEQGWHYLSDDIVPFDPATGCAHPFPVLPRKREVHRTDEIDLANAKKTTFPIPDAQLVREPVPVTGMIFPIYNGVNRETSWGGIERIEAVKVLIENCISFPLNEDKSIHALIALTMELPLARLHYFDIAAALTLIHLREHGERRTS